MTSIGTHKLYLSASGPDREPGQPLILLMPGLGSIIAEWVCVRRLVTPFARWLEYDRSGLGLSESPPDPPKATCAVDVARELDLLLRNAGIEGPFVVVCHSWGGITSREFLHLRKREVLGMVFVDANMERTFEGYEWPMSYITNVNGDLDYIEVTGLAESRKLSDEEWDVVVRTQTNERHQATEKAEQMGYRGDGVVLAAKKQIENCVLEDRPVSVVRANGTRDLWRLWEKGVEVGNGTEDERALYKAFVEEFDGKDEMNNEDILKISRVGRFVRAIDDGHNVQMTNPELVAREVKWVWDEVMKQSA